MQIPSLLYGEYGDVRKRCRKVITRFLHEQQPLWDAIEADGMIDTADHPGLIVVNGPSPLVGAGMHYRCDVPLYLLVTGSVQPSPSVEEEVFTLGLEQPWSLLCMFSRNVMYSWLKDPEHYRRYVQAILPYWELLDAEGPRYSWGSNNGERLWDLPNPLTFALARLGVPHKLLGAPLPQGGLYALLAQADRSLAGELVGLGQANASLWRGVASSIGGDRRPATSTVPDGVFMSDRMNDALRANDPVTVRRLIEDGENIDATDMDTLRSPLLWAAEQGHTDLARFLLDHGADIEDKADEGESPLMLAAFEGHLDTVRLLLDRGANPAYRTDKGWDAMMFAELGKHDDVAAVLKAVQGST